jgi:hypothetical protein
VLPWQVGPQKAEPGFQKKGAGACQVPAPACLALQGVTVRLLTRAVFCAQACGKSPSRGTEANLYAPTACNSKHHSLSADLPAPLVSAPAARQVCRALAWRVLLAPALLTHSQAHCGDSSAGLQTSMFYSQVAMLGPQVNCRFQFCSDGLPEAAMLGHKGTDGHAHATTGKTITQP